MYQANGLLCDVGIALSEYRGRQVESKKLLEGKVKVKQSRYKPGVAQRFPGS
jgi:hypothetical protein